MLRSYPSATLLDPSSPFLGILIIWPSQRTGHRRRFAGTARRPHLGGRGRHHRFGGRDHRRNFGGVATPIRARIKT
jgi:hypothetical protein